MLPLVNRRSRGSCGEKAIPLSAEDLPRTSKQSAKRQAAQEDAAGAKLPRDVPGRGRAGKESAKIFYGFQLFSWMQKQRGILFANAVYETKSVLERSSETGTRSVSLAMGSPPGPTCGWQPRSPSQLAWDRKAPEAKQAVQLKEGRGGEGRICRFKWFQ